MDVTLTFTNDEALHVRMALNLASCHWGSLAQAARDESHIDGARTCEQIRAKYGALWERVARAQGDIPAVHKGFHPPGFDADCDACRARIGLPQSGNESRCADCGAMAAEIVACPDGAEVCQACFDAGRH